MKRVKPHKFGKKNYRPKHKKLRLRKNVRGFKHYELYQKRMTAYMERYYYPSKYLAER